MTMMVRGKEGDKFSFGHFEDEFSVWNLIRATQCTNMYVHVHICEINVN